MLAGRQLLTLAGTNSLYYILQEILVLLRVYFQSHHMNRKGDQRRSEVSSTDKWQLIIPHLSIWQESQCNSNSSKLHSRKHEIPQCWDCYYCIIAAHVRMQNVHFLSVGWYPYNQHTGRHINTQAHLQSTKVITI